MNALPDTPPPLNAVRNFPYRVTPLPLDWLLKFTTLGDAPAADEQTPHEDSHELWT
jgi:hypothetical protein